MARYVSGDELQGARLLEADMTRAVFRNVDLSGARMRGVLLRDADIDGDIRGLTVNGVQIAPLVDAELDRRYPERALLRATDAQGVRRAWSTVQESWDATMRRARALPEDDLHRSVDDEWSFTQTLRHLVFVTDAWFGHAVLGRERPFHPLGLPPSFITDADRYGIDAGATPSFDEVAEVRAERVAQVAEYLRTATQADLDRVREPNSAPGGPPPGRRSAVECLHVLFDEEWAHHRYAVRDLAVLGA